MRYKLTAAKQAELDAKRLAVASGWSTIEDWLEDGWYWRRSTPDSAPTIVCIAAGCHVDTLGVRREVNWSCGEWLGPIVPQHTLAFVEEMRRRAEALADLASREAGPTP